jgi:hypothetical protein
MNNLDIQKRKNSFFGEFVYVSLFLNYEQTSLFEQLVFLEFIRKSEEP